MCGGFREGLFIYGLPPETCPRAALVTKQCPNALWLYTGKHRVLGSQPCRQSVVAPSDPPSSKVRATATAAVRETTAAVRETTAAVKRATAKRATVKQATVK